MESNFSTYNLFQCKAHPDECITHIYTGLDDDSVNCFQCIQEKNLDLKKFYSVKKISTDIDSYYQKIKDVLEKKVKETLPTDIEDFITTKKAVIEDSLKLIVEKKEMLTELTE